MCANVCICSRYVDTRFFLIITTASAAVVNVSFHASRALIITTLFKVVTTLDFAPAERLNCFGENIHSLFFVHIFSSR